MVGCASKTIINSRPSGADVYLDNIKIGVTPFDYSDTAIAGSTKNLKLKKDGYMPLETVIRKNEFQIGPAIGGVFLLFPFIWVLGYPEKCEFELGKGVRANKTLESENSSGSEKKEKKEQKVRKNKRKKKNTAFMPFMILDTGNENIEQTALVANSN
ncbi:MAG: PEGA domain-containing protein [Smithella sp.]